MTDLAILEAAELERRTARLWLERRLDRLCRDNGFEPWEAWRRQRHLDRMAAQDAMNRQLRRDLAKIARPTTDAFGSLEVAGIPIVADATVPPGEARLRDARGRFVGRIRGMS